jgi:hypothetical protein
MSAILARAAKPATAILMAAGMLVAVSGQTMATPAIAQKTSQPCAKCHTAPPTLNDYGKKYKDSQK